MCVCAVCAWMGRALWLLFFVLMVVVEVVQVMGFSQSVPYVGERDACTPALAHVLINCETQPAYIFLATTVRF